MTQPPVDHSSSVFRRQSLLMSNHKASCYAFSCFSLFYIQSHDMESVFLSLFPPTACSPLGPNSRLLERPMESRCLPHRTHPSSCNPGGEGGWKQDVTFQIPVMENLHCRPRGGQLFREFRLEPCALRVDLLENRSIIPLQGVPSGAKQGSSLARGTLSLWTRRTPSPPSFLPSFLWAQGAQTCP